jgi:hypothetical protein
MRRQRFLFFLALAACSFPGHALRFNVAPADPFVFIQIGSGELSRFGLFGPPVSEINVVSFPLPSPGSAGNGTPVFGEPVVPIAFHGFTTKKQTNFVVTMDSSAGLVNSATGDRIPFTDVSWETRDGEIPAGQFDGTANQTLREYNLRGNRAKGIVDFLTFVYANTSVYPGGTYRGRVVYTITQL